LEHLLVQSALCRKLATEIDEVVVLAGKERGLGQAGEERRSEEVEFRRFARLFRRLRN
jgi:hypothetical protein